MPGASPRVRAEEAVRRAEAILGEVKLLQVAVLAAQAEAPAGVRETVEALRGAALEARAVAGSWRATLRSGARPAEIPRCPECGGNHPAAECEVEG